MKKVIYSMLAFLLTTVALTSCEKVPAPYENPNQPTVKTSVLTPTGTGTEADPYNVAAALDKIKALPKDANTEEMCVKGKIVSIKKVDTAQFGNAEYYISDDGTTNGQLYIFRSLNLGNAKFTDENAIKVGDEVVVKGIFTNYKGNTPESVTNKSYLISINGKTSSNNTNNTSVAKSGEGTEASPYNVAAMLERISTLKSEEEVANLYVKGKVVSVKNIDTGKYGTADYYISDDGTAKGQLYIFHSFNVNNEKFTDKNAIQAGDEVVVTGSFTNYKGNTPETVVKKSHLVSIVKGSGNNDNSNNNTENNGGNTPAPAGSNVSINGQTLTLTNSAVTAGTETLSVNVTDLNLTNGELKSAITLSDGTVISFDKGAGKPVPVYNGQHHNIRVYANNVVTFTGKKAIAKIEIKCDQYQGKTNVGNETATVSFDGTKAVYTNVFSGQGGGVQLRILSFVITYAK